MATEHRLIDANALKDRWTIPSPEPINTDAAEVLDSIDEQPTVDAVPVVRCKDCTNFERNFPGYGYCYYWDYEQGMSPNEVEDNDFCSYGERKTNDQN